MRILIVGGGGREHALAWKLAQSPRVGKLFCAPGNAGIETLAECRPIAATDISNLMQFAKQERVDLVVVGPEAPLADGIADIFTRAGIRVFGPNRRAARIEASKTFSKDLMRRRGIPTAAYHSFEDLPNAAEYLESAQLPLVIKADGLAAGKGVAVCHTMEDAKVALRNIMGERSFGRAGDRVVIEEFLRGEECSIIALTDGATIVPLAPCQDHKPALDGDKGPNTGGMGAYSPAPVVTPAMDKAIVRQVLVPTVHALNNADIEYRGVLYAGLMITRGGPRVLEFNCRFGDPECQPLMMRLRTDLLDLIEATIDGTLADVAVEWDSRPAVTVVMASRGYPGKKVEKGAEIHGLDAEDDRDVVVFHAGTVRRGGRVLTAGGRVLGVTALGDTLAQAVERAYQRVARIRFAGAQYRTDIAHRAL